MVSISIRHLTKQFGALRVIDDLSLDVADGEFLVLLGPSGCGKSTLLRILAGLESTTEGEVMIGERRVELEPPGKRDIAFVFQSYALYPHLTVRRNISFPLLMKQFRWWMHLPILGSIMKARIGRETTIADTVADVGRILGLTALMERLPRTLSGGQRQRVALGRAMVRNPAVFLMDEPLSNLDAKLRTSMRGEITRLHARLGGTFVYVTHDQVEAMTMGSRIALMRGGVIQQIGTPRELFQRPENTFVARFIGSPAMNLIQAGVHDGTITLGSASYGIPTGRREFGDKVILGIRPDGLNVSREQTPQSNRGVVTLLEHVGTHSIVGVRLEGVRSVVDDDEPEGVAIMVSVAGYSPLAVDEEVFVTLNFDECVLFDAKSGGRIDL